MSLVQLYLLPIIGLIGIIFNWLLILAIQRKTYHYQHAQRIPSPVLTKTLLRTQSSIAGQIIQPPILPSVRSSISMFDKFILAFLINDIFVCNFLIPLRLLDISQGLSCGFLCFLFNFLEKLSTTVELIIINLLLITSLIFFWKKRLLTKKLWIILFIFMMPILISCLITTITYIDVDEYGYNNRPPTCKQTHVYITAPTEKTLNTICCFITYFLIFINFILLIKMRLAIKIYRQNALKNLTEAAVTPTKTGRSISEQPSLDTNYRRSMYYSASITAEIGTPNATPPIRRSFQQIDYITYLTVIENSHTLIRSTCLILVIYLLVHIPYWFYALSKNPLSYELKDIFFLCHVCKPFCYMLTNEKYRQHIWAILKCKTFRILPNLLRTKSRIVSLNNNLSI
ncbi:unnamed protein product [Adineta steineri]|uniref:G-protein coupled receptors family 1 profile domain-containing protein n=1 Tax=Adineta steineri TaxID=433720 RepID=A0A818IH33_9BILA|nr:unnamed protein product [Adineta steineri]CAF3524438.1 unnamed protein product [Adineta steineri]